MNRIALFAGQGAQYVGMGQDLAAASPAAAKLFTKASDILGYDLGRLCAEGPIEALTASDKCQPAIFTVSAACYEVFRERHPEVLFDGCAGLSLGEWTALWAAGVVTFGDAVRVLAARGKFMQEACEAAPSGMASILSLPAEKVAEIARECGVFVSNINSQAQVNVAGEKGKVEAAVKAAFAAGGKAIVLNVAGAFHSPFMRPARDKLALVLDGIEFHAPSIPVFSNATGAAHSADPAEIKARMLDQITGTVRWLDCILASGAHEFVEFGPGKVLSGLAKRIDRQNKAASIQDIASAEAWA
ncbi:MAG: ACP S-malonyltransferase [Kiritimatiellae bacterium]|nr:ACP S-malonyltransferase [Kiritimatiellia bacterium]